MQKLIFILILFLIACQEQVESSKDAPKQIIKNKQTEVLTAKVLNKGFEHVIKVNGKAEAEKVAELRFMQAGLIRKIFFRNGQQVPQNAAIASLDKSEWLLFEKKSHAEVAQRSEDFKKIFLEYGGDLSQVKKMPDTLLQSLKVRSGLIAAKINLEEAQLRLQRADLLAPFSGIIANLNVKEGALTDMQQAFCTLYDPNSLLVVAEVLQQEALQLQIGQQASISTIYDKTEYRAELKEINPFVESTGLVKIKLRITEKTKIFPGMNLRVRLHIPVSSRLTVPRDAVVNRSGRDVVFTAVKGKAQWNFVTTGLENGSEIEIIEGLKADETVIVSDNLQLSHDAEIKILPSKN
jgi:RND family efflux transporter MFP subunit